MRHDLQNSIKSNKTKIPSNKTAIISLQYGQTAAPAKYQLKTEQNQTRHHTRKQTRLSYTVSPECVTNALTILWETNHIQEYTNIPGHKNPDTHNLDVQICSYTTVCNVQVPHNNEYVTLCRCDGNKQPNMIHAYKKHHAKQEDKHQDKRQKRTRKMKGLVWSVTHRGELDKEALRIPLSDST